MQILNDQELWDVSTACLRSVKGQRVDQNLSQSLIMRNSTLIAALSSLVAAQISRDILSCSIACIITTMQTAGCAAAILDAHVPETSPLISTSPLA
jgi:hypothetical protein